MGYQGTTEPEQVQRLSVARGNGMKDEASPKRLPPTPRAGWRKGAHRSDNVNKQVRWIK